MINKQSLWFLTLFSLILVLSVYYITMPNELLLTNNSLYNDEVDTEKVNSTIEESELLVAMRVNLDEERAMKKIDLEGLLTSNTTTIEEKNEAFEELKYLNFLSGREEEIEIKLKSELEIDSFVEIDGKEITVVAIKDKHDSVLANKIMRVVQSMFEDKMYITVKFEK